MKKYLSIIILISIIISCDIEEGPFIIGSNTYVNPDKKVLIEDFTGHLCPNCPGAAREIDAIHDIYGDQIIGMAIHVSTSFASPNAIGSSFDYDFRTNWGDDLDDFYGISAMGLPRGMVNRTGFPNNHKLGKGEWASKVALELNKDIDFKIYISSNENSINIISNVQNNLNSNYNLVVCLTENNIINWQKDGSENIEEYVHNHVLRTILMDENLSNSTNYITGQQIEKTINYDLSILEQSNIQYSTNNISGLGNGNAGGWDESNINIVAYIYDNTTKEILQVEEASLNN